MHCNWMGSPGKGYAFLLSVFFRCTAAVILLSVTSFWRKLGSGEGNAAEHLAWVFRAAGVIAAFLGGNAVIQHGNNKLCIPFQTNDGELTEGDVEFPLFWIETQFFIKHGFYRIRRLHGGGFLTSALANIPYFGTKHHGIQNLYNSSGAIGIAPGYAIGRVELGVASVDVGTAVFTT